MVEIQRVIIEIEKLRNSRTPVIVEGKKDVAAMQKFGLNVISLKGPIFRFCEEFSEQYKEAAILTDLDKEGKTLYSKIKTNLERNGVRINDSLRLALLEDTKVSHIEGLWTYMEKYGDGKLVQG